MPDTTRDLVANEVIDALASEERRAESLDTKAGLVLGFAGVVVALVGGSNTLTTAGQLIATGAATLALLAFLPRPYPVLELRDLRERYRSADPAFTIHRLTSTRIEMIDRVRRLVEVKIARLRWASLVLVAGLVLVAAGLILDAARRWS